MTGRAATPLWVPLTRQRTTTDSLWDEFRKFDIDDRLTSFAMPVVFMPGRHDFQVPAVLAARYFERINAPARRLVWFEDSAPNPPFEEPERFHGVLLGVLRPIMDSERVLEHVSSAR